MSVISTPAALAALQLGIIELPARKPPTGPRIKGKVTIRGGRS